MLVLDAWPILEWFRGRHPSASRLDRLFLDAQRDQVSLPISRMNVREIFYITARGYNHNQAMSLVKQLTLMFIQLISVTDQDMEAAAELKSRYRISYADTFAANLAIVQSAPLVTGDLEFRALEEDGHVELKWVGA